MTPRKLCLAIFFAIFALPLCAEPPVIPGIEVLLSEQSHLIRGKRIGLITNHTGVDRQGRHDIDLLAKAPEVKLLALFSPEHGIRGTAQAGEEVESSTDAASGLPVYSLYGQVTKPTAKMLQNLDALVYDIQDVGARFYTYTTTMRECMQAAAEKGIPFIVLDRPDPLGGEIVEGRLLDQQFRSFVGSSTVPIRYGLTLGELAGFMKAENQLQSLQLTIVKMKGWRRELWYDQTGLPWVAPSPNIPTLETALVYAGMCLLEGTNLSEGRGTNQPFEMNGAPWLEKERLAEAMNGSGLPGVKFQPVSFTPRSSKFAGQLCHGIRVQVTDRSSFQPVLTALTLISHIRHHYPNLFRWNTAHFDRLAGSDDVRLAVEKGFTARQIVASWQTELKRFELQHQKYFLYP